MVRLVSTIEKSISCTVLWLLRNAGTTTDNFLGVSFSYENLP